jgi:MerR family transcriptional regulator, thiopeptide resistance regulator
MTPTSGPGRIVSFALIVLQFALTLTRREAAGFTAPMPFTVGDLARLTGVTVRALHHYDEIGLVRPSQRTAAGYRLYEDADVAVLQQVLVLRELGLPLDEIARVLESGSRAELLRRHRDALVDKRAHIDAMIAAVDTALGHLEEKRTMKPEDVKQMFDGFDHSQYEEESRERWGDSDAWKESARRTSSYSKEQWQQLKDEWAVIYKQMADLMNAGAVVTEPAVQALVERHRMHIDRWFYACSKDMHKNLGAMYIADPRFTANIDKVADGFTQYLADAIAAS